MNHSAKISLFAIWLMVLSFAIYSYLGSELSLSDVAGRLQEFIARHGVWGPIFYIAVYSFRSLILFPASLLSAISGLLFGPWYGILYTVIGENISANISFVVARYFGSGLIKHLGSRSKLIRSLDCKFRKNGFMAVLMMRLMYAPFDLVGYMSGLCNIRQREFALGTVLGTIPGLATFVLLGSAITETKNLALAFAFFVLGWILSRCMKERELLKELVSSV